jgi:phenylalanine ammonia-lyase
MMSILVNDDFSIRKLNKQRILIGGDSTLTLQDAKLLAKKAIPVELVREAYSTVEESYAFLNKGVAQRDAIYGINTQFGDQVNILEPYLKNDQNDTRDYYDSINARQINLIRSHSCGLGHLIPAEVIKVTMMLRAHCLGQGYSGVRLKTITGMLDFLNSGIVPVVRSYGSIGASGDLIPLAMIAACVTGQEVDVYYRNERMRATKAIALAGLEKLVPESRDGLAMINGTSFMAGITSLALYNLRRLFRQMLSAIAMSLESMFVIESAYHPTVHQLKKHQGEIEVNSFLLNFWKESRLVYDLDELRIANRDNNHYMDAAEPKRVQDFYSLRAVSQGFGPFFENLERSIQWIEEEMNSVNDNPIIDCVNEKIFHSANFMGYYITTACDMLKADIAQASTWIHALLANMVHPRKSFQLPTNLVPDPSKQNGFRPLQILAASLAVQNRKLAQAQQSYMLPTEGDNQDVNSLGAHAALDFRESVDNLERLTAILLLASVQALEFRNLELTSKQSKIICKVLREHSPPITDCRPMTEELQGVIHLLEEELI